MDYNTSVKVGSHGGSVAPAVWGTVRVCPRIPIGGGSESAPLTEKPENGLWIRTTMNNDVLLEVPVRVWPKEDGAQ